MAIVKSTSYGTGFAYNTTWTLTISTIAGDLLVAVVNGGSGNATVTYDGIALTLVGLIDVGNSNCAGIYYLENCSTKTDKSLIYANGEPYCYGFFATRFTGVTTSSSLVTYSTSTSACYLSYTPNNANNLMVSFARHNANWGTGYTPRINNIAIAGGAYTGGYGYHISTLDGARDVGFNSGTFPRILMAEFASFVTVVDYTILPEVGVFTISGINLFFRKFLHLIASVGEFTLTGINALLQLGAVVRYMTAQTITFVITTTNTLFTKILKMITSVGEFVLTGIDQFIAAPVSMKAKVIAFIITEKTVSLICKIHNHIMSVFKGIFILTGMKINFKGRLWENEGKNSSLWYNKTKHLSSTAKLTKHTGSWTNKQKS